MQPTMDEKIAKLQFATDEAEADLKVCKEALELSERLLYEVKEKYRSQAQHQQQQKKDDNGSSSGSSSSSSSDTNNNLEVNDTELPELLETRIRAKNVYETVEARYNTNKRYLYVMIQKQKTNNV
jgi:hypothetical protein